MSGMRIDSVGPSADLVRLAAALRSAVDDVAYDFAQCSKLERRGMVAMQLHRLYGWIAARYPDASGEALAYRMISHAWWIAGLVLQRDRKAEVKAATDAGAWRARMQRDDAAPELLALAQTAGVLKDEAVVEALSAALWRMLGLDAKTRHKP